MKYVQNGPFHNRGGYFWNLPHSFTKLTTFCKKELQFLAHPLRYLRASGNQWYKRCFYTELEFVVSFAKCGPNNVSSFSKVSSPPKKFAETVFDEGAKIEKIRYFKLLLLIFNVTKVTSNFEIFIKNSTCSNFLKRWFFCAPHRARTRCVVHGSRCPCDAPGRDCFATSIARSSIIAHR